MYDINKQSKPSLCSFSCSNLSYYLYHSQTIACLQPKAHHYHKQCHITQLLQTICRQLFYYSSSMQKVTSIEQQFSVQNILLQNIKKIIVFNLDRHGLIMEQKLFYLVVSLLHSKHNRVQNLREFLNEVHEVLTSNVWEQKKQQIPFGMVMLLNGQYEELIDYAKEEMASSGQSQQLESLIDLLVYKIEEKQNSNQKSYLPKTHILNLIAQVNDSEWIKKLLPQIKKKNQNIYSLFQTKHEIELILAILSGNQEVIDEVSRGSWGLFLNLYISFMQSVVKQTSTKPSYETVIRSYLHRYLPQNKQIKKSTQQQEQVFLIKLLTTQNPNNRFSFHQIYQSSFGIFSPVISNLVGLLLLQCKVVDYFSLFNNKDYYEDILLNLIDNCNKVGWTALVYTIGFVQNSSYFRDYHGKEAMWENLMFQYLPFEIDTSSGSSNSLQNQIKQIEQKLQDLNLVGLSTFTKTYLNTLFQLELNNSNKKLTQTILELFFLTLQMSDSSNANSCFHQVKIFMSQYYRTYRFDYSLLDSLQNIFQRKQSTLSQKIQQKIEKLFSLIYKIQNIYDLANTLVNIQTQQQHQTKSLLITQLNQFNQLFTSSKKKKSISLSVQLLRLGAYLHSRVQHILNIGAEKIPQMTPQNETQLATSPQQELNAVKVFQWNLHSYLNEWKALGQEKQNQQKLSEQASEQMNYFDKYFY